MTTGFWLRHSRSSARWVQLALLSLLVGCGTQVVNPVSGRAERSVMDESSEVAEGRKAHPQILAEYGVVADTRLQAYVNQIGQRLAQQSHRTQLVWTFTVLDSSEINAFALPGGFIYITRGLMAYLNDEAELAGVLGHEIGHVTARHGAQQATRQQTAGAGVIAATLLGAVLEGAGVDGATRLANQVSQGLAAGRLASYSRDQETQADRLGAEYLARNRYNPRNMIEVIAVLKAQERYAADQARAEGRAAPSAPNWLASHPSNDKRLADITQFASAYGGGFQDDGRNRYLQAIDGMTFGDSREQGVVRGRQFFHEGLGIALTAPQGWTVQNAAEAISLINGAGDAGVIVRLVPEKSGRTHEEIIRQLFNPSEGRVEKRQLNGLPATHFSGLRRDDRGAVRPIQVSVVTGPAQRMFLLLYAARDANARQRSLAQMEQAENSFRPLGAAEAALARPYVLRSAPTPRGGLAQIARSAPDPARAEAQLRLLNGVYGGGEEPAPGTMIKLVQ